MGIIKVVLNKYKAMKDPVGYAKSIGVNVCGGGHIFQSHNWGSEPWLIKIGSHVRITANVHFITHDGGTWVFTQQDRYRGVIKYGAIEIKDNCFIGLGSIIMPGVTIGPNSVIGAGSVVTKDVPEGTVYAGNPARFICRTEDYAEKSLRNMPNYDIKSYHEDKEKEVLRILGLSDWKE